MVLVGALPMKTDEPASETLKAVSKMPADIVSMILVSLMSCGLLFIMDRHLNKAGDAQERAAAALEALVIQDKDENDGIQKLIEAVLKGK